MSAANINRISYSVLGFAVQKIFFDFKEWLKLDSPPHLAAIRLPIVPGYDVSLTQVFDRTL